MKKETLNIETIKTMLKDYNNLLLIDIANYINIHRNKFNKIDLAKIIVALSVCATFEGKAEDTKQFATVLNTIDCYL